MRMLMVMSIVLFAARAAAAAPAAKPAKTPTKVAGIRTVFIPSPSSPLCAIRLFFQVGAIESRQMSTK